MKDNYDNDSCIKCQFKCIKSLDLGSEEIEMLSKNKRIINYEKGETVIKQSTFVSHISFLHSGLLKIYVESRNGKNVIICFAVTGEILGSTSLFSENYYHYSAVALKQSKLCLIEKNAFIQIIEKDPRIAIQILKLYGQNFEALYKKIETLGTKQLHGRLADAIIYLKEEELKNENIFSYITRKDIADMCAMSLESMLRLLNEFKNDRIINITGKDIEINNYELIKKLSERG